MTGGGTGSPTGVTGSGTGYDKEVTGGGTGSTILVTGGGTGSEAVTITLPDGTGISMELVVGCDFDGCVDDVFGVFDLEGFSKESGLLFASILGIPDPVTPLGGSLFADRLFRADPTG